jgi:hypothetical protein
MYRRHGNAHRGCGIVSRLHWFQGSAVGSEWVHFQLEPVTVMSSALPVLPFLAFST